MAAPVTPYAMLGEDKIREIAVRFYENMNAMPEAATIRSMHAADLTVIQEKLFQYLSEWMGGPRLYSAQTGTVCLTVPHKPYAIGAAERDQWLACMQKTLDDVGLNDEMKDMLRRPLFSVADILRTQK